MDTLAQRKIRSLMRRDHLLPATASIGLLFMFMFRMGPAVVDPDLWHQMALAREVLALGYLPFEDHFAYTETLYPSVQHEWGAGVIALLLTDGFGATGIVIARLVLGVVLSGLVVIGARLRGAGTPILLFLAPLPIIMLGAGFSALRAQIYSFVCVATLLVFLECDRRGQRWWIPIWLAIYVVWLNVHAGFLAGIGLTSAWWVEQVCRRRRHIHLAILVLAMGIFIMATPYGLYYFAYLWRAVAMPRPHVAEWRPLYQSENEIYLVLFALSLVLAGYGAVVRRHDRAAGISLVAISALIALQSSRLSFFYAIVWAFFVPAWLQQTPFGTRVEGLFRAFRRFLTGFWIVSAFVFLVLLLPLRPWKLYVPGGPEPSWGKHAIYPVGPVDYLAAKGFEGNLMVPFDWGAYVIWKLYPKVKVSMDSRYEVAYPDHVEREQYRLYMAEDGWQALFFKYASDAILVHVNQPLATLLPNMPGWHMVYQDKFWELYARKEIELPLEQYPDKVFMGQFP